VGELVRYADDGVALCRTVAQAQAALGAVRDILVSLGLECHYFRSGNAATKFRQADTATKFRQADNYVVWRLRTLMVKSGAATCAPAKHRRGRNSGSTGTACTACVAPSATRSQRNHAKKIIGKPHAGKPCIRIERGWGNGALAAPRP
jgi:hypothetical protein